MSEAFETFGSPEPARKKRKKWPWVVGLSAVVVAGGAYAGAAQYYADKIPAQTRVAGVKVGGMSKDDAAALLASQVNEQLATDVTVSVGDATATVKPSDLGAAFDEKATLDSLVGFSLDPRRIWNGITGGSEVDPVISVDGAKVTSVVSDLSSQTNTKAADASVAFEGVTAKVTDGVSGVTLDTAGAAEVLSTKLLSASPLVLPVSTTEPDITTAEAEDAVAKIATPLVSGNLSVNVDSSLVTLTPEQLASVSSFTAKDSALSLTMDQKKLNELVTKAAPDVIKAGTDARIEIVDHKTPKIIPSTDGIGVDAADLAKKVEAAAVTTDRTVDVKTTKVPASFTTEDAQKLGVKEVVAAIDTPLTSDNVRTQNLLTGTAKVTNTLVKPGETFSLLTALGPIDAEHGFVASGVVSNGFDSTAMGGGVSQLSTNTFNLGYLSGMEDVEHKPHSKYFARYPMGREATLWTGQIDMKWKNTTPYGAVIDTWVENGRVYSQLWSTKYYEVSTTTSAPYNLVAPTTKTNPAADCKPEPAGGNGFTVNVGRTVTLDGKTVEDSSYSWTYQPVNAVVCG